MDGLTNSVGVYRSTNLVNGWSYLISYAKTNQTGTNVWVDAITPDSWDNVFYRIVVPTN